MSNLVTATAAYLSENGKVISFADAQKRLRPEPEEPSVSDAERMFLLISRMGASFVRNPKSWWELSNSKKLGHINLLKLEEHFGKVKNINASKYYKTNVDTMRQAMEEGIKPLSDGLTALDVFGLYFMKDDNWFLVVKTNKDQFWLPI